jgi:glutamate-1-semialdehyde 2,1-aminomutase
VPTSPGVPASTAEHTINAPFNDLDTLQEIFRQVGEDIAAVIVEPVPGNMGVIPPAPGFLAGLRQLTQQYGALLIIDEVMTGFRVAYGGAQVLYNVEPDITCLGKIIGGGLPVGAYAGKRAIMSTVAPAGPVYQAGTLSGNPLAVTAGIATLQLLRQPGVYDELETKSARLDQGLRQAASEAGLELTFNRVGSMLCTFFTNEPVTDFDSASKSDTEQFARYFAGMLQKGVYLAPSQFEAAFMSLVHTDAQIDQTIEAARAVFKEIQK